MIWLSCSVNGLLIIGLFLSIRVILELKKDNASKDKIIRKIRREKNRLLDKMHKGRTYKDGTAPLSLPDDWWAASADLDLAVNNLIQKTNCIRETVGNYKFPIDAEAIIRSFIKRLQKLI